MQGNWQITKDTLSERMNYMRMQNFLCDARVVAHSEDEIEVFWAHKLVLSGTSRILYQRMQENNELHLHDVRPELVECFLQSIYTDRLCSEDEELIADLLLFAYQYQVPSLYRQCERYLLEHITVDLVGRVVHAAVTLDWQMDATLTVKALQYSLRNAHSVLRSPSFTKLQASTLLFFLRQQYMDVTDVDIYQSLLVWAAAACHNRDVNPIPRNLRAALKPFLPHIRFLTFTLEEYTSGPGASRMFTNNEDMVILSKIANGKGETLRGFCWDARVRSPHCDQFHLEICTGWPNKLVSLVQPVNFGLTFTADAPVFLLSVTLSAFCSAKRVLDVNATLTVQHDGPGHIHSGDVAFRVPIYADKLSSINIDFPSPVYCERATTWMIMLTTKATVGLVYVPGKMGTKRRGQAGPATLSCAKVADTFPFTSIGLFSISVP